MMLPFSQDPVAPASVSTFAALTLGEVTLVVARDEIRTLEMVDDMEPASPQDRELGWYELQGERIPVFGLGDKLEPLRQRPPTRRIAVVLASSEDSIAILCDDIAFFEEDEISFKEIPECMNRRRPLLTGLGIYASSVACVTTGRSLATYFLR